MTDAQMDAVRRALGGLEDAFADIAEQHGRYAKAKSDKADRMWGESLHYLRFANDTEQARHWEDRARQQDNASRYQRGFSDGVSRCLDIVQHQLGGLDFPEVTDMAYCYGRRLGQLLECRGIEPHALAVAVNVTDEAVSRYLSGERLPCPPTRLLVAKFLSVADDYLLGRTDDPNYKPLPAGYFRRDPVTGITVSVPADEDTGQLFDTGSVPADGASLGGMGASADRAESSSDDAVSAVDKTASLKAASRRGLDGCPLLKDSDAVSIDAVFGTVRDLLFRARDSLSALLEEDRRQEFLPQWARGELLGVQDELRRIRLAVDLLPVEGEETRKASDSSGG